MQSNWSMPTATIRLDRQDSIFAVPLRRIVNKPFCDGTHSKIGFQAAEAAVKKADETAPPLRTKARRITAHLLRPV